MFHPVRLSLLLLSGCSVCFFLFPAADAAVPSGSFVYHADELAVFADPPTRTPAATRLECGARCLTASSAADASDCAAFAFSAADGACGIGYRLNWTAGSGGWLGQADCRFRRINNNRSWRWRHNRRRHNCRRYNRRRNASTNNGSKGTLFGFLGGGGRTFDSGRTQCQSMGYADLVSYDNRMGGSSMPNEFNITADLFKSYTVRLGLGRQHQRALRHGGQDPPYSMRSVDCATPVEAVICELV
uniref:Apple domain-containing protein n=1 Tax=Macrostomum lignano TaxID=282301 RepID=A0A1I8GND6_9PLAT